ncbi:hypothetical protein GCM10009801_16770 [Streptomyces albiaxialis]|uniref:Endonuclease/exonuclease/phosphatase domain-containing protein n=1 Tax=Streptomyces albiaxialis TaxID=329523 RepID=A0ABN2VPH0_9ACTN
MRYKVALDRKIDYLFFSDRGWDLVGGDVVRTGSELYTDGLLSDHWMVRGQIRPPA